jgi:hypothetical protein
MVGYDELTLIVGGISYDHASVAREEKRNMAGFAARGVERNL